jgi:hypothetical protein
LVANTSGDALRIKPDTAMVNETLCNLLCHNQVVQIHELHELGNDPRDWGSFPVPKKGPVSMTVPGLTPMQEAVGD